MALLVDAKWLRGLQSITVGNEQKELATAIKKADQQQQQRNLGSRSGSSTAKNGLGLDAPSTTATGTVGRRVSQVILIQGLLICAALSTLTALKTLPADERQHLQSHLRSLFGVLLLIDVPRSNHFISSSADSSSSGNSSSGSGAGSGMTGSSASDPHSATAAAAAAATTAVSQVATAEIWDKYYKLYNQICDQEMLSEAEAAALMPLMLDRTSPQLATIFRCADTTEALAKQLRRFVIAVLQNNKQRV